jgi:dipeptidyl aminopeptidase/acylaminoacyl peptidase
MKLTAWLALAACSVALADDLQPPQISDLYKTDVALDAITLSDGKSAFYIRQQVDQATRSLKQSLWKVDAEGNARAVEPGEPDVLSLTLSPDGKWLVLLSTRPFADGTPAFQPVPPYTDPAVDIWFMPVTGGKAIPLGGKDKPYGRVITDKFYGRVAFSPDGKKLLFVADEGLDPRTEAEKKNNVIIVRDDQGEGYERLRPHTGLGGGFESCSG